MIICLRMTGDGLSRETVRIDGHYQFALPLKEKQLVLPDNSMAPMKSLKKRFEGDELFYIQCKCFMDEIIDKEYARNRDWVVSTGRTWYIQYQAVLDPSKGKIRVAFDCSSQY